LAIDLHLHTTYSDGRWSPSQVVAEAAARGLEAISITDHDVVAGLGEARQAAEAGGLQFVDGVELTADWDGRVCHILGYGIEPGHDGLGAALARGQTQMQAHVREVLAEIRALGFEMSEADLERYNTRYATGTSLVLAMLEQGIVRRSPEARRLLSLASREPRAYTAQAAIELIHAAGGLAALAHPARLRRQAPLVESEELRPLVEWGLDGLEVWHVLQPEPVRQHYLAICDALDLLPVGGSDCHGPRSTGVRIGSQQVPASVLRGLLERLPRKEGSPSGDGLND
jgi:predicted metal-dependent phosphoesterase TrpH